jgi:hypothetical protein
MALNINQFIQTPVKGMCDLKFNPSTVSVQIDVSSAGGLVPGQAVKIVDSANGVPLVVECSSDADDVFGFINYGIKDQVYNAGMYAEISAFAGNVMYMEAGAAIARGAKVEIVVSGNKVQTASGVSTVVGRAFDKATASGDLIRVYINLPGLSAQVASFAQAATVAAVTTPAATDLPTTEALANQLKTTVNAILTNLKAANLMA